MNKPTIITADLDAPTRAIVRDLATAWGISEAELVRTAVRRMVEEERDLSAFLRVGSEQIARGEFVENDVFRGNLRRWREERVRPTRCG